MMKKVREPCLPPGWYPRDPGAITAFLAPFRTSAVNAINAAVAPHAGWYYSGAVAAVAVRALAVSRGGEAAPETVAVIGGHLPAGAKPLFALEDAAATPLGDMEIDAVLRDLMMEALDGKEDRYADNTVEVLLPLVRYFFPESKILWARFPAEISSFEAGKTLAAAAGSLGRRIKVLASTDLTHYGANYGFSPRGYGADALEWVKNVNDRRFIEAVIAGRADEALLRAEREQSACSAGAVLGAMGFASAGGCCFPPAVLLDYRTSASAVLAEGGDFPGSFVGYAAIGWS